MLAYAGNCNWTVSPDCCVTAGERGQKRTRNILITGYSGRNEGTNCAVREDAKVSFDARLVVALWNLPSDQCSWWGGGGVPQVQKAFAPPAHMPFVRTLRKSLSTSLAIYTFLYFRKLRCILNEK